MPTDTAEQLLGALREALSNAARHAEATAVEVRVSAADALSLAVTDKGVGMKQGGRRSGLKNLERRAGECSGSLRVESAPGAGTRLEWQVPVR